MGDYAYFFAYTWNTDATYAYINTLDVAVATPTTLRTTINGPDGSSTTVDVPLTLSALPPSGSTITQIAEVITTDRLPSTSTTSTGSSSTTAEGSVTSSTGSTTSAPSGSSTSSSTSSVSNSSRTPSPTSSSNSTPNGLSTGVTAGIAIGCAAAGALIAGLLIFLCMRRRNRSKSSGYTGRALSPDQYHDADAKSAGVVTVPSNLKDSAGAIDAALPPPMQERDIESAISALGTQIKNHAQSFYAGGSQVVQAAGDTIVSNQMAMLLGDEAHVKEDQISQLLGDPQTRVAAVRLLIAWSILRNIDFHAPAETTLLPPDLAESIHHMTGGAQDNNKTPKSNLLNKWRQLSGALMQSKYGDGTMLNQNDPRHQNVHELAEALNNILAPYATQADSERARNLSGLVKRGARCGYMLFAQPTTWAFGWKGVQQHEIVVFPNLIQTGDEHGRHFERPQFWGQRQTTTI